MRTRLFFLSAFVLIPAIAFADSSNEAISTSPENIPLYEDVAPPEVQCPIKQLDVEQYWWIGGERRGYDRRNSEGRSLGCLSELVRQAVAVCGPVMDSSNFDRWRYHDDCIVKGFLLQDAGTINFLRDRFGIRIPNPGLNPIMQNNWSRLCNRFGGCLSATFYLDENCNSLDQLSREERNSACSLGRFNWATPISLVWRRGAKVDEGFATSYFPLELGSTTRAYRWKASADTPLLVFDPERTGKITSATQLFGRWTFGGKTVAAKANGASVTDFGEISAGWENGFEALATLDANKDGEVSGQELGSLSLWFDVNQNGISEEGEVATLESKGVERLFYQPNRVDSLHKTIYADRGFERVKEGRKIVGALADWNAETAKTEFELLSRSMLRGEVCDSTGEIAEIEESSEGEISREAKSVETAMFEGVWRWKLSDESIAPEDRSTGLLSFSQGDDGVIKGFSVFEASFDENEKKANIMQVVPLHGDVLSSEETSSAKIRFSVRAPSGWSTRSEASLDSAKGVISGTSSTFLKGKKVTYAWTAQRMN